MQSNNENELLTLLVPIQVANWVQYPSALESVHPLVLPLVHCTLLFTQECIPVGCIPPASVAISGKGVSAQGVSASGVSARGRCLPMLRGQECLPRGMFVTPPKCGRTDTCENITLPKTSFTGGNKIQFYLCRNRNRYWAV